MVAVGDSRQGGHRLALAARAEHEHLVRPVLVELGRPDQRVVRDLDVAEVSRDVDVLAHRAADDNDFAAGPDGDVDRLLHSMDVRGKAGDEHAPLAPRDDLIERLPDQPLGAGEAGSLGVRRVAEQQVDTHRAQLGESSDVGSLSVHRGVVELPVAGHQHPAGGALQHDRHRVRHGMRDADELDAERTDLLVPVLGPGLLQLHGLRQPVLVEP